MPHGEAALVALQTDQLAVALAALQVPRNFTWRFVPFLREGVHGNATYIAGFLEIISSVR